MFGAEGTGDTSGYGGLVRTPAATGSSERPYGSYFDDVADDLERAYPAFSDAIERVVVDRGELTLHVKREKLVEVSKILRDSLKFEMCMGVSGVHYPEQSGRELHAVYRISHQLLKYGPEIIGMNVKLLTCSESFLTDIQDLQEF